MPRNLSLSQLRAIEAVDRLGSFSLAARDIGVSQPSVSNHVQTVESHFGVKLFRRHRLGITSTPLLEELLPAIRAALSMTDDIAAQLSRRKELELGSLAIGYSTYQVAVPYMTRFMKAFPSIRVEARAMASHDLLPELERGQLDLCFITAREIPAHLVGREILSARLVLAVPPDHPFAARIQVDWTEIAGLPLIQREKSSGTRRIFEAAAKLARVELNTILGVGSWGTIVTMVRAGIGLGVALDAEIQPSDGLVAVLVNDRSLQARHYLVCLPEMQLVSPVRRFLDLVARPG